MSMQIARKVVSHFQQIKQPASEVEKLTKREYEILALLAKGFLESAGVESFLIDETTIRMDWLWSNLLGGVKLCVNQEDADAASQILSQEIPEKFSIDGAEDFEQPRCPQCQSLDISYEDLNKPATYASTFLLSLPIQVSCRRWNCQSCGYVWDQTDEESKQNT